MSDTSVPRSLATTANFNITKDDLVAIRIAEVERQIHEDVLSTQLQRRSLEAQSAKLAESLEGTKRNIAQGTITQSAGELINTLQLSLINLFPDQEVKVGYEAVIHTGKWLATANVSLLSTTVVRPINASGVNEILNIESQINDVTKSIRACDERLLELKRSLSNIPMLERQARAAVAKAVISGGSDDGGDALLGIIKTVSFPGLPAPK